jgi:hypothetical protein
MKDGGAVDVVRLGRQRVRRVSGMYTVGKDVREMSGKWRTERGRGDLPTEVAQIRGCSLVRLYVLCEDIHPIPGTEIPTIPGRA